MQRLGHAQPAAGLRTVAGQIASLSLIAAARPSKPGQWPLARGLGRARQSVGDIYVFARHGRSRMRAAVAALEADLVEARLLADQWRGQAESSDRRAAELETRLAASEMTALDLRSRLVCLHGKLATTAATARYQTLSQALEQQPPAPSQD